MSIKALSVPAVVIAGLIVLLSHRRVRDAAASAAIAVAVYVIAALPFGIGRVWEQSYSYHQDARRVNTHSGAPHKVLDTLWDRRPPGDDRAGLAAMPSSCGSWPAAGAGAAVTGR